MTTTIAKTVPPGRRALGLLAVALVSFSPSCVRADADDATGAANSEKRPIEELFKTDLVYPQEKGELELELASVYQDHSGADTWTLPLSLEYGLTDRWQVEAEWDSLVQRHSRHQPAARGVGDLQIGSQYSFLNIGGSLWHIAPRFSVEFPVGDVNKDLSEGFMEYQPALILARDFPELHHTQFFTEIGASFLKRALTPADKADIQPAAHELDWGTGGFVLFPHAAATLEFNWADNQWNHHGTGDEMYLTPGCLWRAARNVELGLGIPVGLNSGADRFDVTAHMVWEF
jgi:hypothetical protein